MASKRWLNIVVDGDASMGPCWPKIFSDYLEKIVRNFSDRSRGEGADTAACEFGLVLYNANADLGYEVQFFNWTRDVDLFLDTLSHLAFDGDGNQCTLAEGLVEALGMYPRPCAGMQTQEFFKGERHCILVPVVQPFPRKTKLALPNIINREGEIVGTKMEICTVDFYSVSRKFAPLAVSLSVISPRQLPVFREIFNLGNNIPQIPSAPLSSSRDQFLVLLSRNFKEARHALHGKRIMDPSTERSAEIEKATPNIALPKAVTPSLPEDLFFFGKTTEVPTVSGQNVEAAKAESQLVVQNKNATYGSQVSDPFSSSSSMAVYGDIMAELEADNGIVLPRNKSLTSLPLQEDNLKALFQPNQIPFGDIGDSVRLQKKTKSTKKTISVQALLAMEGEFRQALLGTPQNESASQSIFASTSNASKEATKSSPPVVVPIAYTPSTGMRPQEVYLEPRGNMSVLKPVISSFNYSTSNFLPGNSSSSQPVGQQAQYGGWQSTSGTMETTARFQGINAWDAQIPAGVGFGSMYPHAMGYPGIQPSPSSFLQRFPEICTPPAARGPGGSFSGLFMEQNVLGYDRELITPFGPPPPPAPAVGAGSLVPMTTMPPRIHSRLVLPPASLYQPEYLESWEGSISGVLEPDNLCLVKAKAYRKSTAPMTLTVEWPRWLQICQTVPVRSVNEATRSCLDPVEYVVFDVSRHYTNDLYNYMKTTNLCVKILLSTQTLILSPTNSPYSFTGTVFYGVQNFRGQASI